ncbi:hypothetical protein CRUP_008533, partial [Coryphaenoides rupestris]
MLTSFRCQRKCNELEVQRADFSSRYSQLEQEKRDMVQYLKHSVAQLEEELAGVSERLVLEQRARVEQSCSLDLQLSQLHQDYREERDKLSLENMALAGKLASLEEFEEQRERLMSDLSSLEEQLANQKEEYDKAAVELQQKAQHGVSQGVARCLGERAALQGELAHLAEQNQALVQENQTFRDTETLLRRKDQVLEPLIRELSHSKQSNLRETICQGLQHIQTQHTLLLAEVQALRQEHEQVQEKGRKDAVTVKRLEAELEEERKRRGQTETILQEAAVALRQALTEERKKEEQEEEEVQVVVRRNQIMQKLLAILDGVARLGADCDLFSEETLLAWGPGSGTKAEPDLQGVQGGLPFQDRLPAPK